MGTADGKRGQLRKRMTRHEHKAGLFTQTCALTLSTGFMADVFADFFADDIGTGFQETPLHVGDNTFEGVAALHMTTPFIEVSEFNLFLATAIKDGLADRFGQFLEWGVKVKPVVAGQRIQE